MSIKTINPSTLYDGTSTGMSQATVDTDTGLIFISGQVADHEVKNADIAAQTENAAKNLITVLKEANSSVDNLLQLRIYVRGEVADHIEKIIPIIVKYLGGSRPALTGIGVASLATPDLLIEIEAVAKVSK